MKHGLRFGPMIREARERAGWTRGDFSEKIQCSRNQVYDFETERTIPNDFDLLDRIAYHLELDIEMLWSAKIASQQKWSAKSLNNAAMGLSLLSAEYLSQRQVDTGDVKVPPKKRLEIEEHAQNACEKLFPDEVGRGEPIPIMSLYRAPSFLRLLGTLPRVITGAMEYKSGVEGRTFFDDEQNAIHVELRKDVYEQAENGKGRARFSAAHELAHAVFHTDALIEGAGEVFFRDGAMTATKAHESLPVFENPEWQANVWAAAFLMPEKGVRQFVQSVEVAKLTSLSVSEQVAEHFQVSSTAAHYRMQELFWRLAKTPE